MLSKRGHYTERVGLPIPPTKRLRHNVANLFLSNELSGERTQGLASDSSLAGAGNMEDLARAGNSGQTPKHTARDLRRKLSKNSGWPPLYWAEVRVWSPKRQLMEPRLIPFVLPHEIINTLAFYTPEVFFFPSPKALSLIHI